MSYASLNKCNLMYVWMYVKGSAVGFAAKLLISSHDKLLAIKNNTQGEILYEDSQSKQTQIITGCITIIDRWAS